MASIAAIVSYVIIAFVVIWLVLILTVLQPDEVSEHPNEQIDTGITFSDTVSPKTSHQLKSYATKKHEFKSLDLDTLTPAVRSDLSIPLKPVPQSTEWLFIRTVNDHGKLNAAVQKEPSAKQHKPIRIITNKHAEAPHVVVKKETPLPKAGRPAYELSWPPVLSDQTTMPEGDGYDIMPMIDLKVPRFFLPKEGEDYNKVGSKVNGEETIFLMIASYRDFQCRETITSAYSRADHPERLYIGAVDQVVPGDIGCLDLDVPCSEDSSQMICKYRDQISVYKMDAQYATGPVTARHVGDRMYRGQYFVMQMDAHCQFVRHWDKLIIDQWRSTHNEMAVMSSYLTDVQGSFTAEGDSTRHTRPIMCNSDYEGMMPARYLRHGAQPEEEPSIYDMPQLEPFWAAGFSFSRGHFKMRVPYDAYQPMVFQGEEIAIGIRGFTHGYDFYAPKDSVVFHEYASKSNRRKKVHMFWENTGHAGMGQKSLKRGTAVIGMAPDIDAAAWDHSELDRYGLGSVRTVDLFYKLFLIDVKSRKATQLCPFVKSGIMHKAFQPYLRADGLGIDYSKLENYDTRTVLEKHLLSQHPYWEKQIRMFMASKQKDSLRYALTNAGRIGLDKKKPELMKEAQEVLNAP